LPSGSANAACEVLDVENREVVAEAARDAAATADVCAKMPFAPMPSEEWFRLGCRPYGGAIAAIASALAEGEADTDVQYFLSRERTFAGGAAAAAMLASNIACAPLPYRY